MSNDLQFVAWVVTSLVTAMGIAAVLIGAAMHVFKPKPNPSKVTYTWSRLPPWERY